MMLLNRFKNKEPQTPSDDIVIVVMGPTGSGKSTFINLLLNETRMKVGDDLHSCTSEISSETITFNDNPALKGYKFTIVDTPGFDDTYEEDFVILEHIAHWLEKMYREKKTLGGVIYLHDVSHNRFTGTLRRSLDMFNHLIGEAALKNVLIGVTHLDRATDEELEKRVYQMKTDHWRPMIEAGSLLSEFHNTHESAVMFIQSIVDIMVHNTILQIQSEIVDDGKIIPETRAGRHLRYTLQEVLEMQKKMAAFDQCMAKDGDTDAAERLRDTRDKLSSLTAQIQRLKVPVSRKLKRMFRIF